MPIQAPPELVLPTYRIFRYTDTIYKLVKFKRRAGYVFTDRKSDSPKYENKLEASISRTKRVVLEYALCNNWEYFCTFTLSKDKYDRYNLEKWYKSFLQWIRDQRKKGLPIKYLLVPEQHKDGAWHMHGFFSGVGTELVSFSDERKNGLKVTDKLVSGDYYDWPAYREKFGFCSFAFVRSSVASAFYVLKYISKDIGDSTIAVGKHQFFSSRPLNRSSVQVEIYNDSQYLDSFLENDYQFCRTGMTKTKDSLDWTFGLEYVDFEPLFDSDQTEEVEKCCDEFYEITQLSFDDLPV